MIIAKCIKYPSFFLPSFLRLLADFRLGQFDLEVEIRRCGNDEKKEEADGQQSDAEAQTQGMIWVFLFFFLQLPTEKENKMNFRTSTFNVLLFHLMSDGVLLHWYRPV